MEESYCHKDKRVTPCVDPSGFITDERGRTQYFCKCGVCGTKKSRYITSPIIITNDNTSDKYILIRRL